MLSRHRRFRRTTVVTAALVLSGFSQLAHSQAKDPQFPGAGFQIDMLDRVLVFEPPIPLTVHPQRRKVRAALMAGGVAVFCRHGATDWLSGDVPDEASVADRNDRGKQRNLTALGIAQAQVIREAVDKLGLKLSPVLSSFYFRTREFGEIATGQTPVVRDELIATRYSTIETWWRIVADSQSRPTITFISAHGQPSGAMKLRLGEGDCAVAKADGDKRLNIIAVLAASDWCLLMVP